MKLIMESWRKAMREAEDSDHARASSALGQIGVIVEKMQEGDSKYEYSDLQRVVLRQRELFNQNVERFRPFSESEKGRFLATFSALNGTISEEYLRHNAQDDLLNSRSLG